MSDDLPAALPEGEAAGRLRATRRALSLGVALVASVDAGLAFLLTQTGHPWSLRVAILVCAVPFGVVMGWILDRLIPEDAYRQAVRQAKADGRAVQVLTRRGLVTVLGGLAVVGFGLIYALARLSVR